MSFKTSATVFQRNIDECFYSTYAAIDLTFPKFQWFPKNPQIIISHPGTLALLQSISGHHMVISPKLS